ncbi:MAG: phosphoribosylanthranilate isomerase [Deltaproteobacteria bacterium]|nr:phosphoribosylanthranilate isomerase [Deltaproteobacteria bacterium]MBW2111792.1 phosphoribosylanthranilate isomerase [Deltaproteobacteria bacterium]MBW2353547.1 phosphoribosylanthranilate isomerase [Deltaproteobacteria bacterium]
MVRVKVCGITNHDDAALAAGLGAYALGFIFAPSPRRITPEKARKIIEALPPFVKTVGVFVNERPDAVRRIMGFCGLDLVQFHGDEPPGMCEEFMPQVIKTFRVKDDSSLSAIPPYQGKIRAVLLDTYVKGQPGGTGKVFDWNIAARARARGIPVILSGGLTPYNIGGAVSRARPCGVDVNSGVEEHPGRKDHLLMEELMKVVGKGGKGWR